MLMMSQAMTTNYLSEIELTYFDSGVEGDSTALVQLKNSGKQFIRLPGQALELRDLTSGTSEKTHPFGGTALNSVCATNIPKASLRPGEALASDMSK